MGVHRARLEGVAVVCLLHRSGTVTVSSQCVYNVSIFLYPNYIVNVSKSCCPCPSALRTMSALPVVFQFPSAHQPHRRCLSPTSTAIILSHTCSAVFVDGPRHWLTSREHLYLCEDADGPAKALSMRRIPNHPWEPLTGT